MQNDAPTPIPEDANTDVIKLVDDIDFSDMELGPPAATCEIGCESCQ